MARTKKNHKTRKAEILQKAQKIFYTQGYEITTVDHILKAVKISKGAFYHYFASKEDLLDCLVSLVTEQIIENLKVIIDDPALSALEKLKKFSKTGVDIKSGNKELLKAYLTASFRSENIVMRNKMMKTAADLSTPLYTTLIQQGINEGVFNTPCPEFAARMLIWMGIGLQESYWEAFVAIDDKPENVARIEEQIGFYLDAMERILGAPQGSLSGLVSETDIAAAFRKELS
jgi:AcrR family transcriptional regulator